MDRIAHTLAEFTWLELDRIAALFEAMGDALPQGLSIWIRHLVDHERDARAGIRYLLCRPDLAIGSSGLAAALAAATRMRNASIDTATSRLLDAVVQVLEDERDGMRGLRI